MYMYIQYMYNPVHVHVHVYTCTCTMYMCHRLPSCGTIYEDQPSVGLYMKASHLCCMCMTCDTHTPGHPSTADEAWYWLIHVQLCTGLLQPKELWLSTFSCFSCTCTRAHIHAHAHHMHVHVHVHVNSPYIQEVATYWS